jgi:hypothetical protein
MRSPKKTVFHAIIAGAAGANSVGNTEAANRHWPKPGAFLPCAIPILLRLL